jgi:hypothetical protein
MNEKILVLFEETQKYKKEDLTQFISLNRKETTVSTLEEVLKNKTIKDFYYILDCTFEHKAFNANVNKGQKLKQGTIEYLLVNDNKGIICKGPNISQLSTYNSTVPAIKEKFEESLKLYNDCIDFLIRKNIRLRNKDSFNKGTDTGLIMNDVLSGSKSKTYKLVYTLPEIKEPGVEYVLFDNIEILEKLKQIIDMEFV